MALTALPYTYCTAGDVEAVLSANGLLVSLDDEQNGSVSAEQLAYLTERFIPYESARVNMYLLGRYDAADLATSYIVKDITAIAVARRVRTRRGNPAPASLTELHEENVEMLKSVKKGEMALEEIPERVSGAIAWSNIHHSRHLLRRNRVQRKISEQTPSQRPRNIDLPSEFTGNELYWL